jgi:hypothetical protein
MREISNAALLAALVVLVAACAPRVGPQNGATQTVVLPSMERCLHAGFGATLAFDGDRLAWTCESPVGVTRGLLGEPSVSGVDVAWRLVVAERGAAGAFVITSDETIGGSAVRLVLATGETCAFAGAGATPVLDEERVHYTCPGGVVVVGDLIGDVNGLVAVRGTLRANGGVTRLVDPRPVRVTSVMLQ